MKLNLTEDQIKASIIKDSLVENLSETDLQLIEGQPSTRLSQALTKLAEAFGEQVVLEALNDLLTEATVTKPLTAKQKADLKAAIDKDAPPETIAAQTKVMQIENTPGVADMVDKKINGPSATNGI